MTPPNALQPVIPITANSAVLWVPTSAAAGTVEGSVKKLYRGAIVAGSSFTVTTSDGSAPGAGCTFEYVILG